ncbi:hypothetical protein SAY87_015140 [Trapa incisa]|uniref:Bifunctional inhibitor/plant lipid transfer protein/seed storage helical domain-containing protein n=1 Tax=Trapa incisa TaxID=236973 RepID=A0AAN7JKT8_9MYRT|nr:hypothetical protein SAY87_015140 [Trapa incisa]
MVSVKLVVAAFVVAALAAAVAEGQSTPSCALEPCVKYANAMSTPSEACCSPTREMVANEKDSLFTQVWVLAKSCNADANTVCSGYIESLISSLSQ